MNQIAKDFAYAAIDGILRRAEGLSDTNPYAFAPSREHVIAQVVNDHAVSWSVEVWCNQSAYISRNASRKGCLLSRELCLDESVYPPMDILVPALLFLFGSDCYVSVQRVGRIAV